MRKLDAESLAGGHVRARITGKITWVDGTRSFFLQDKWGGGIHVERPKIDGDLLQGQTVEAEGSITRSHPYASMAGTFVRMLDPKTARPIPRRMETAADLNSLTWQYSFVELSGIVRVSNAGRGDQSSLNLYTHDQNVRLDIRDAAGFDYSRLVDARLRVPGVFCISVDAEGQPAGVELKVQSTDDLFVVDPAPDPAGIRLSTVAELIKSAEPPAHRVRVHGSLVRGADSFIFRDATGRLPLRASEWGELAEATDVDVVAFASKEQGTHVLIEGARLTKGAASQSKTLTNVREIQNLSIQEFSRAHPAQIEGTVTYSDPSVNDTFVQDETGGIFIFSPTTGKLNLKAGQFVRITGFASAGGFAPVIVEPKAEVLATRPLPKPLPLDMEQLLDRRGR